tara:strand:- start:495 stop:971 length:477 start_codon:yes stop_codon:yes gene_type:complete
VADIDENADFSEFNGVDRIITLIHGNDITLNFDHGQQHLLKPFEPFPFKGEHKLKAVLHQGGVRDLNLMMSRKHVSGSLISVREATEIACDPTCFYWLFCPTGHWQVKSETNKQSSVWELNALDYLRFDLSLTQVSLKPVTADSAVLVATIQPGAHTE